MPGFGHGPIAGPVEPGWTGRRDYNLDDPANARVFYGRVLADALESSAGKTG